MAALGAHEIPGVLARHAIVVPALALIGWQFLDGPLSPALAGLAYAIVSTALAFCYGAYVAAYERAGKPEGGINTLIELTRGAAFGAALVVIFAA